MGDESDEKQDKKKRYQPKKDQPLVLPKTTADKQRMQIEKLMRNPVSLKKKRKPYTKHENFNIFIIWYNLPELKLGY